MKSFDSQDIGFKEIKNTFNNINSDFIMEGVPFEGKIVHTFDPPYSHHSSPYIYNNNNPGELRAESRISETASGNAWVMRVGDTWGNDTHANQNNVENSDDAPYYYQIDLSSGGNIKNYVSGVVTAGRRNGQYVTKWKYQYYHNNHWHWVDNGKIFNGNENDDEPKGILFSRPVYTTGIRFFPIATVNNNIASRMALLLDHYIFDPPYNHHTTNAYRYAVDDTNYGIGMDMHMSGRLSETSKMWVGTLDSYWTNHHFNLSNISHYWEINTSINNTLKKVTGVVVKGRADSNVQYVTKWNFLYSTDGSSWLEVPGNPYEGNNNNNDTLFIFFKESLFTTGIRFCPAGFVNHAAARMALLMSKQVKASELNDYEEIFDPPYTHHSSTANGTSLVGDDGGGLGRLSEMNHSAGWVARIKTGSTTSTWANTDHINADNEKYYWQINITADGEGKKIVKGVVTKGRRNGNSDGSRVTQFKLQYSSNGINWDWVDGGYTFKGNDDPNTNNFIYFNEPLITTGIRFFPTAYVGLSPGIRMALIIDNKLYSSALELSEPFNENKVLDIEWGYRKGFASIQVNNKIHTLFSINDSSTDNSWTSNYLISKTSYPVENNIYELSLKHMDNYVNSVNMYYFSIDFNNEVGSHTSYYQYNLSNYKLYNNNGPVQNWWDGLPSSNVVHFGTVPNNAYSKILIDGINGKVQFVINDVLQTTKEYDLTTSEKTGKFYVKVLGYSGKAVLRLRKLNKHPFPTTIIEYVNSQELNNFDDLDIEWGTTLGFVSRKISYNGMDKVYELISNTSSSWGSSKLVSSTSYPMKDNIYILSLKMMSGNYFFGIDYSTAVGSTYLHNFIRYQVYFTTSSVKTRLYNQPHQHGGSYNETLLLNGNYSNKYVDIILDGINGKVHFIINGISSKSIVEYTMNNNDLNGNFYVKVDCGSADSRAYLSLRKISSWEAAPSRPRGRYSMSNLDVSRNIQISREELKVSENMTGSKNVAGIALKGLSDYTYVDELKLDRICNTVEWNKTSSGTNIVFHDDNSVTGRIVYYRTEAYFTSKQKIYYSSDKVQGVRFKAIANNKNVFFGIGEKGYFTRKTHADDPRLNIRYGWYCHENGTAYAIISNGNNWSYTSDTIFDIRIDGATVSFYMDNVLKKTILINSYTISSKDSSTDWGLSTTVGNFPFYLMGTIYHIDGGVKDVELYGDWMIPITKDLNAIKYDLEEPIEWYPSGTSGKTGKMDITDNGTVLRRAVEADHTGFDAHASSVDTFSFSNEYYQGIKCNPVHTDDWLVFGFKHASENFSDDNNNDDHLEYGFYIQPYDRPNNMIRILESGSAIKDFRLSNVYDPRPTSTSDGYLPPYSLDDTFEVRILGEQVEYLINDNIIFYSQIKAGRDYVFEFATTNWGSQLVGSSDYEDPHIHPGIRNVMKTKKYVSNIKWNAPVGFAIAGNSIIQNTDQTNWDSKLESITTIDRNEHCWQGVEYQQVIEKNIPYSCHFKIGLDSNHFTTDWNYKDEIAYSFGTDNVYQRQVVWDPIRQSNVTIGTDTNPSSIKKSNTATAWDAYAMSLQKITRDDNNWQGVKFSANTQTSSSTKSVSNAGGVMIGLGNNFNEANVNTNTSARYKNLQFAFFFYVPYNNDYRQRIYEYPSGTQGTDHGSGSWDTNTMYEVRVKGTTVEYLKNGSLFYTSTQDAQYPLYVETSLAYKQNNGLKNVEIYTTTPLIHSGDDKYRVLVKGDTIRYVKNDEIVSESIQETPIEYPLYIKITGAESRGNGIKNVKLIADTVDENIDNNNWSKNIIWGASLNMNIISNNHIVSSTDQTTWNSYIKSITSIERDDLNWQGIKFQTTKSYDDTSSSTPGRYYTRVAFGHLDFTGTADFNMELPHPFYIRSNDGGNKIEVQGDYGSNSNVASIDIEHTEYDIFQIMVKGEQVRYIINGVVHHELTRNDIVYPLNIKIATSNSRNQGIRNLQILRSNVFKTNSILDPNKERNIIFDKPIETALIKVTPLIWNTSNTNGKYGEYRLLMAKDVVGNGNALKIYDPEYTYHSTNSANMVYLNGTSNSLGLYDRGRISEPDLIKYPDGYSSAWIPNITNNDNSYGSLQVQYFGDSTNNTLGSISNTVGIPIWGWPGWVSGNSVEGTTDAAVVGAANGGPIYKNPTGSSPLYVCFFNSGGHIKYSYFNIDANGNYVWAKYGYYTVPLTTLQFQSYIDTIDSNHLTKIFNGKVYFNGIEEDMTGYGVHTSQPYKLSYIKTSINPGNIHYDIETTIDSSARYIYGVAVKGGYGEEFIKVPSKSWTNSEAYCVSEGGYLLSIHSLTENNQQHSWRATKGSWGSYPWIGGKSISKWNNVSWNRYTITGNSRKDFFIWTDGTPMNYLGPSFSTNDAHQTYMHLYAGNSTWGTYTSTQYGIGKIPRKGYVTKWKFQYLSPLDVWTDVDEGAVFTGMESTVGEGWDSPKQILFSSPVYAKKIRFIPQEYYNMCAARMGLLIKDNYEEHHSTNSHYLTQNEINNLNINSQLVFKNSLNNTWIPNHNVSLTTPRENLLGESFGGEGPSHSGTNTGRGDIWYEIAPSNNNECKYINAVNVNTGSLGLHFEIEFNVTGTNPGTCQVSLNGSNVPNTYGSPGAGINTWVFDSDGNHINDHGVSNAQMYGSATGRAQWEIWTNEVNNRNIGDIIVVSSRDYISAPEYPSNTWSFFDQYGSSVIKGYGTGKSEMWTNNPSGVDEGGQMPYGSRYGCCCLFIYGRPELGIYEYVSANRSVGEPSRHVYVYKDFIKTSGRNGYMTEFKLQYKNENDEYVDLNSGNEYTFSSTPSNSVNDVTKTINFDPPLFAKSIRVIPWSWNNFITARVSITPKLPENIEQNEINIQKQIRNTSYSNEIIVKNQNRYEDVFGNKKYFQPQDSYTFNLFDSTNLITSTHQYAGIGGWKLGETFEITTPFNIVDEEESSYFEKIIWDHTYNFIVNSRDNTKITKTGSDGWNSFAIARTQPIYRNDNIWQGVKYQFVANTMFNMTGLSTRTETVTTNTYYQIDFALYVRPTSSGSEIEVFESTNNGSSSNEKFSTGQPIYCTDTFEVRVKGDIVQYLKNNIVFYTSTNAPSYPLYVKSVSHDICDGIENVVIYNENKIGVVTNPIYWDYTYGLTVDSTDNTKITKTSGANWNSFAISRNQPIYRNENVWQGVKYNLVTDPIVTVGLGPRTDTVTTDGYKQADFSIYHHHTTNYDLRIYEGNNGNVNIVGPTITEATNNTDIFEVRVKGDVIQYLRNNIVFYTSTNTPSSYPLYVKAAVYRYDNDGIENVEIFTENVIDKSNYTLEVNSGKIGEYAIDNYKFFDTFIQKYNSNSWYLGIYNKGHQYFGDSTQYTLGSISNIVGTPIWGWPGTSGSNAVSATSYVGTANGGPIYKNPTGSSPLYVCPFNGNGHIKYSYFDIDANGNYDWTHRGYYTVTLSESAFQSYIDTIDSNHLTKIFNGQLYFNGVVKNMVAFDSHYTEPYKLSYIKTEGTGPLESKVINISLDLKKHNKLLLTYHGGGYESHDPPPKGWYNNMGDYYNTNRNNAYYLRELNVTIKKNYKYSVNQQYDTERMNGIGVMPQSASQLILTGIAKTFKKIIWDKDNDNHVSYEDNETSLYNTYSGAYANNWWNTYAISKTQIKRDDNNWQILSFQLSSTSSTPAHYTRMGVGHTTEWNITGPNGTISQKGSVYPRNYNLIDFQWYIRDNNEYYIEEGLLSDIDRPVDEDVTISTDDIYEIRIKGDVVKYFRNEIHIYTSSRKPIYPLYIKFNTEHAEAYSLIPNQGVTNVKLYKEYASTIDWDLENSVNINKSMLNNEGIINRASGTSWDTFLYSKTPIYRQDDHYQCVKFQITSTNKYNAVGFGYLSSSKYSSSYINSLNFGIYISSSQIRIWEGNVDGTAAGINEDGNSSHGPKNLSISYSTDDWFEVRVIGTKIEYLYNDNVIFTSPHEAVFPLFIEVVPKSTSGGPKNVQFYRKKVGNYLSYGLTNSFKYSGDPTTENYENVFNDTNIVVSDISWNLNKTSNINFNADGSITRYTSLSTGWDSYTVATDKIYQNNDVYQGIKCNANQTYGYVNFGLKNSAGEIVSGSTNSCTYGMYLNAHTTTSGSNVSTTNAIRIRETTDGGLDMSNKKDFHEGASTNNPNNTSDGYLQNYTTNDILEVRVKGTMIEYVVNDVVIYYSTIEVTFFPLYPFIISWGAWNGSYVGGAVGLKNVQIYKYEQSTTSPTILSEYNQQNIQWNLNMSKYINFNTNGSVETTQTSYVNIGHGNDYWPAILMSTEKIYRNDDNYQSIKFQKKTLSSEFIIGLSQNHSGAQPYEDWVGGVHRYGHIDFGLIVRGDSHTNALEIYERKESPSSSSVFDQAITALTTPKITLDDIFEIRVKGKTVEYLKNNVVFHTSTKDAKFPLYVRSAISTQGGGIKNIQLNINHSPYAAKSELTWDESNSHYIDFNSNGSITSNLSNDWRSRTISHQLIYYNPNLIQGIRFQTNTHSSAHKVIGLGVDTIWDAPSDTWHYNAIHFATYINSSSVKVYESDPTIGVSDDNAAVNRGTISSTSTDDDIFEIRVIGRTVEYVKNGEVYYTSTNNAVFPLYVKACIYRDGFKNIELFKDRYPLKRVEWDENHSVNVKIDNTRKVIKNSNVNAWDSNCFSIQKIERNENIWQGIRIQSIKENKQNHCMLGLGKYENALSTSTYFFSNIKFGIYFWYNVNSLKVREDGDHKGDYCISSGGYSPNDLFEVRVKGKFVEYLKNGTVFRNNFTTTDEVGDTFSAPPFVTYPLYASGAFGYQSGVGVKNVEFFKHVEWDLQRTVNINLNYDGSITKRHTDEEEVFNSGTTSKCYILRDNDIYQGIKFKFKPDSSNKTFAMVGLSSEKEWVNYVGTNPEGWSDMLKDIDYGYYFRNNEYSSNGLYIRENNIGKWYPSTTYTQNSNAFNDIFEIRVKGRTVEYLKNGVVLYASTKEASFPLYVKIAIYQRQSYVDRGVQYVEMYSIDDLYNKCKQGDDVLWDRTLDRNINYHSNFVGATATDARSIAISLQSIQYNPTVYQGIQFQLFNGGYCHVGLGRKYSSPTSLSQSYNYPEYSIYNRADRIDGYSYAVIENDRDTNTKYHRWPYDGDWDKYQKGYKYNDDDIWEIRVLGNTVEYLLNGEVFYTSEKSVPINAWPLYLIYAPNKETSAYSDNPDYQGIRNVRFINYSKGFYLTDKNYFQNVNTPVYNTVGITNEPIKMWKNIHDGRVSTKEDNNALQIFSTSPGSETIDGLGNKNVYRAKFSSEIVSETFSENNVVKGIWFQFELNEGYKCIPSNIKMSYVDLNNIPSRFILYGSNDIDVSVYPKVTTKWKEIKQCIFDMSNNLMTMDTVNKTITFDIHKSVEYCYFRLVVTNIYNSDTLSFYNLQLNGNVKKIN